MSDLDEPEDRGRRRRARIGLILAAAVAVIIVVVVLVVAQSRRATDIVPPPATTPTVSVTPSASTTTPSASDRPTTPASSASGASSTPTSTPPNVEPSGSTTAVAGNQTTKTPVPIDKKSEVKPGLTASVEKAEAVTGKAEGPGEVGGPAIRFRVVVDNAASEKADLSTTVVNLYYGNQKTPASPISNPGGSPLPASVAARGQARGTYLFVVPKDSRDKVLITVDYSVDTSVVAFQGRFPS